MKTFLRLGARVMTLTEWSRELRISALTLSARINKLRWSPERALTTPVAVQRDRGPGNGQMYRSWWHAMERCSNPNFKQFKDYGGRGITVCEAWQSYDGFWNDMHATWKKGLTLERIDNKQGYSKKNCRWATMQEQSRNTRRNRKINFRGTIRVLKDWASQIGINQSTLRWRLDRSGWPLEKAMTKPAGNQRKRYADAVAV